MKEDICLLRIDFSLPCNKGGSRFADVAYLLPGNESRIAPLNLLDLK